MTKVMRSDILEQAQAIAAQHAQRLSALTDLQTRIDALGGVDAAEAVAAWKIDAIEKIDTLPLTTRTVVKKLLGLE